MILERGIMSKRFNNRTFRKIEQIYSVYLPDEFKTVYGKMEELPENWYDWSDFSPQNVKMLSNHIQVIKENIAEEIEYVDWSDNWGEAPSDLELMKREIRSRLINSPTLFPISGHRYIASCNTAFSPVFSIVGSDIIYYSKSLTDYFHGIAISRETNLSDLPQIPFWSDIAQ